MSTPRFTLKQRMRVIAALEDEVGEEDAEAEKLQNENKIRAAKAIGEAVARGNKIYSLNQLKKQFMPRSSWEQFAEVMTLGHRAGVVVMSRSDLTQVKGYSPKVTGEIRTPEGSVYNFVRPSAQPLNKSKYLPNEEYTPD